MKRTGFSAMLATILMLAGAHVLAQTTGQGRAVVTVLSKHSENAPNVTAQDVSAKVNGKDAEVIGWRPFKGAGDSLELVVLIDAGARNLGSQIDEIASFIRNQGPLTKIVVGYMQNGEAVLAGHLSTDHNQVVSELHLPAGPTSNPYFSLSDLAKNWPSQDRNARREVLVFSDGVDPENPRFDPNDLYVQSAINDSVRAGLVVYSIYWLNRTERDGSSIAENGGLSLLSEVSQATGGSSYWTGTGNPVSFKPFFADLERRLASQYGLEFTAHFDRKPAVESLKLKVEGIGLQVTAPQQVYVGRQGAQ